MRSELRPPPTSTLTTFGEQAQTIDQSLVAGEKKQKPHINARVISANPLLDEGKGGVGGREAMDCKCSIVSLASKKRQQTKQTEHDRAPVLGYGQAAHACDENQGRNLHFANN